jgi:hypothetical protein
VLFSLLNEAVDCRIATSPSDKNIIQLKITQHEFAKMMCKTRMPPVSVQSHYSVASNVSKGRHIKSSLTTRHGAWGERRYSSYSFSTSALDGGERSGSRPGRTLAPGKDPPVHIVQEAGWASKPVWTQRLEEKSSHLCQGSNLDRPVVQPLVRHYTDWARGRNINY